MLNQETANAFVMGIGIASICMFAGYMYYWEQKDKRRRRRLEDNQLNDCQISAAELEAPLEIVEFPVESTASTVRKAVAKSVKLNLLAMNSFGQMLGTAKLHQSVPSAKPHPQDTVEYRRMEWMDGNDDWRSDRF